ncbi:MAG TPA: hypothetical protein VER03_03765 [Bryobacteraceae bacterium]|nr:hypothetical protein [Bryobacteraceae bacterium]
MRVAACLVLAAVSVTSQVPEDDFHVYTEPPRLLLTASRLKLLKRERERQSERWQQFEALVAGKAQMAEPALAHGLYHQVTGDAVSAKSAAAAARDARSLALAYDWLPAHREELKGRLRTALSPGIPTTVEGARNLAFVAIALEDHTALERLVKDWWRKQIAPALLSGQRVISHADVYPLMEFLHVIRDNLNIDLRDDARPYFHDLPTERLLSYYPPTFPAPENDFRIPFGPPDLKIAALSRAAELSLVAFDSNSTATQFVQGWLMHDRFMMRGVFGVAYEFLWANPYQPGLSYDKVPLRFHDPRAGRLFLRSSWEEDAVWVGYTGGKAEVLREGKPQPFQVNRTIVVGETVITPAKSPMRIEVKADHPTHWYILGWKPQAWIDVEAEDEELDEAFADRGGILALQLKRKQDMSVRLKTHGTP